MAMCMDTRPNDNEDVYKGAIKIAYNKKIVISNVKLLIILIVIIPATKI